KEEGAVLIDELSEALAFVPWGTGIVFLFTEPVERFIHPKVRRGHPVGSALAVKRGGQHPGRPPVIFLRHVRHPTGNERRFAYPPVRHVTDDVNLGIRPCLVEYFQFLLPTEEVVGSALMGEGSDVHMLLGEWRKREWGRGNSEVSGNLPHEV